MVSKTNFSHEKRMSIGYSCVNPSTISTFGEPASKRSTDSWQIREHVETNISPTVDSLGWFKGKFTGNTLTKVPVVSCRFSPKPILWSGMRFICPMVLLWRRFAGDWEVLGGAGRRSLQFGMEIKSQKDRRWLTSWFHHEGCLKGIPPSSYLGI